MSSAICFNLDYSKKFSSGNRLNSLSDYRIIALSKLKGSADDYSYLSQMIKFRFGHVENIAGN